MENIPLFTRFYTSERWLLGISEPSTVWKTRGKYHIHQEISAMLHVTSPPFYKKIENGSMIPQKSSKSKSPCGYNKSKCKISWYQKAQLQFTKPKKTTDIRQVLFLKDLVSKEPCSLICGPWCVFLSLPMRFLDLAIVQKSLTLSLNGIILLIG